MRMSVGRSGASVCKVYMSAVAGGNGEGRVTAKLMMMVIMGVCTEGDVVEMTVSGGNCFAGHCGEAVVMAFFTGVCKHGTSENLVYVLFFVGVVISGVCIKITHGRYLPFPINLRHQGTEGSHQVLLSEHLLKQ